MKFAMLIYETADDINVRGTEQQKPLIGAWRTYYKAMLDAGIYVTGAPLQPESTGTTVRVRSGQRQVQDGPYAATKEQLGGFIVMDLPSLDAALEWAARCPTAASGAVEIRPVSDEVRELVEGTGG